jgi:hypothetical protein
MKVVPMVCGSSFKNKGVQTMLDYVMELLPSPLDKDDIVGINPDTNEEVLITPKETEPFAALAFKIATDPFVGRLCFIRAYSGILESGSYVYNTRSENKERISRVFQMHANKQNQIERLHAGDIGAGHTVTALYELVTVNHVEATGQAHKPAETPVVSDGQASTGKASGTPLVDSGVPAGAGVEFKSRASPGQQPKKVNGGPNEGRVGGVGHLGVVKVPDIAHGTRRGFCRAVPARTHAKGSGHVG